MKVLFTLGYLTFYMKAANVKRGTERYFLPYDIMFEQETIMVELKDGYTGVCSQGTDQGNPAFSKLHCPYTFSYMYVPSFSERSHPI